MADTYGGISAIRFDPIEKKPLYHFHPGKEILSLGSLGCNLRCSFCQNWQISRAVAGDNLGNTGKPEEIVTLAGTRSNNAGVAYTYNEPTVWYEFMIHTARRVREIGMKNVMVSNGYIAEEPLEELMECVDAFNIDLKAFSDDFYIKHTGARLAPVLNTLKNIRKKERHLEITCLIIPTLNDSASEFRKMIRWISTELGRGTVLHLSRYHPDYKMTIGPTSPATLERLYGIAREQLYYVYVGNIELKDYQDTRCHQCGELVITRRAYHTTLTGINKDGCCLHCNSRVINYS
jgi:pyruvate formate lyase activating enzyme